MEELVIKIGEMLDEKLNVLEQKIENSKEELREEIVDTEEKLRKEMLDQFFLFEQKYGDRIIMIGELALLDNQKNLVNEFQ